jgi:hypothetical protein
MNLFGGSENYILKSFNVSCGEKENGISSDVPSLTLVIDKVHNTSQTLSFPFGSSISLVAAEVTDDYEPKNETVDLFVEGIGRFKIEEMPYNKRTFEIFKKTIQGTQYFSLKVKVSIKASVLQDRNKFSFTDTDLTFETISQYASFSINNDVEKELTKAIIASTNISQS